MTKPDTNTNTNTTTSGDGRSTRSRATILGVSAGLVGGGLVGLAMTVPSLTSAASVDADDTQPAALVDTDTTSDDSTTDSTTDTTQVDRGARLRAALQELVDAGTITSDQADAVAEHLADELPDRGRHRGHRGGPGGHPGMDGEIVAELLGMDAAELRSSLRDGMSIADLADANGVDVQTVIDALVAEAEEHLELAVENGRLTEAEASQKLAEITERITARVNGERPARD